MKLFNDKIIFNTLVAEASKSLNIPIQIVEKDYFVTELLKVLVKRMPNILFKGGTSLSKCYDLIKRFSEDLDITIVDDFTQSKRQIVKKEIVAACDELNFKIINLDQTKSRRNFNKYKIDYMPSCDILGVRQNIYVETVFIVKSFPAVTAKVDSILYKYLKSINRDDIIKQYELDVFDITTQSIERTFIDKIFAICDYYISNDIYEHSRHLYDLYKLLPNIVFDENFYKLFNEVRKYRKINKQCCSAQDGQKLNELLTEIVNQNVYEKDYKEITSKLLYEEINYDIVINSLKKIIKEVSNL